ncbi:MAG: cyclic nucleotide-binding domain-containing protein [Alphaproteobacteria bacterium]|nr:cyclic nucleotide-binding domain-containing protein [Alphaproteobacteria bacterium]
MELNDSDIGAVLQSGILGTNRKVVVKILRDSNAFISTFLPGQLVCRSGDKADRMWVIVEGSLEIFGESQGRSIRLPVTRNVGEVVGEQGILDKDETRKATVKSGGITRVVTLLQSGVTKISSPKLQGKVWKNLSRVLSQKLAQATQHRTQVISAGIDANNTIDLFTNEYARRNLKTYLEGKDPYKRVKSVFWFSDVVGDSVPGRGV